MSCVARRTFLSANECMCMYLHVWGEEEGNGEAREAGSSQICCFYSKKSLKKKIGGFNLSLKKSNETLLRDCEMLKFYFFIYIVLYTLLFLLE